MVASGPSSLTSPAVSPAGPDPLGPAFAWWTPSRRRRGRRWRCGRGRSATYSTQRPPHDGAGVPITPDSKRLVPAATEFLLYAAPDGAVKVRVLFKDETAWLTQKALPELLGVGVPAINKHLKSIFESGELAADSVTAHDTFADHEPGGHTLYTADMMTHPEHQHHGIARALTNAGRDLVRGRRIWRMVGGSRLAGYHEWVGKLAPEDYVDRVRRGELVDPVLTAHLHDGWEAVAPIFGYLPQDGESAGWSAVIQWINPESPAPPGFELSRLPRR